MDISGILSELKAASTGPNVTITSNAARTYMDAARVQDHLKRLEHEAERLLHEHYDKHDAAPVENRLKALIAGVKKVDDRPGLALFVNRDVARAVHLPFDVQEQVTVGDRFQTRELLRAGSDTVAYHVLLLSSGHARLFKAEDAHLTGEERGDFPMENRHYTTDVMQITTSRGQDNQERHFHKDVDQAVEKLVGADGIVVVASVADHYAHYMQAVARPSMYYGNLKGSFDHVAPKDLVEQAWEVVHAERKKRQMKELEQAAQLTTRLFSTSVEDIWAQVSEGRGQVLFVERDKHQAAVLENDRIVLVDERADHAAGIDLVDAIIEEHLGHGGQLRILPNGSMSTYGGIALKLRY